MNDDNEDYSTWTHEELVAEAKRRGYL